MRAVRDRSSPPLEGKVRVSLEREGGVARCPSCSPRPHNQNVLPRCAQSRATLAAPLKRGLANRKAPVGRTRYAFARVALGGIQPPRVQFRTQSEGTSGDIG